MERIKGFPCSKCKILTAGDVISKTKELRNKDFTIVKVKADCCGIEFVEYFTKFRLHHYDVKEVEEVLLNH